MPTLNARARVGLKGFLDVCTDHELRQLAKLIKKQPYRSRINEQLSIFTSGKNQTIK